MTLLPWATAARQARRISERLLSGESFLLTMYDKPIAVLRPLLPSETVTVTVTINGETVRALEDSNG